MAPSFDIPSEFEGNDRMILESLSALKPRHRRNGVRVVTAMLDSPRLVEAHRLAVAGGDAKSLQMSSAGFLSSWMEGRAAATPIVAVLLARAEKGGPPGEYASGILEAMRAAGLIGS